MMWIYRGPWPIQKQKVPALPSARQPAHVYIIDFNTRRKVGISTTAFSRIASLVWEHEKLAGEKPTQVAITWPHTAARRFEEILLHETTTEKLKGEYVGEEFESLCKRLAELWQDAENALTGDWIGQPLSGRPTMFRLGQPGVTWAVVATLAEKRGPGRRKRVRKCFTDETEAKEYHALLTRLWRVDWLERQQDALTALKVIEGHPVTLTELARRYAAKHR